MPELPFAVALAELLLFLPPQAASTSRQLRARAREREIRRIERNLRT